MTEAARLIRDVRSLGATLNAQGSSLRLSAPRPLPSPVVDRLKAMKAEVLAALASEVAGASHRVRVDPADQIERAAIVEHDGGIPGAYAEEFARLQQTCPPGVPEARWRQSINDGGLFLDHWGNDALRLCWTAEDLFGLDPIAPMARYDRMGLIWLLWGQRVVALTARAARLANGLAYYRS